MHGHICKAQNCFGVSKPLLKHLKCLFWNDLAIYDGNNWGSAHNSPNIAMEALGFSVAVLTEDVFGMAILV